MKRILHNLKISIQLVAAALLLVPITLGTPASAQNPATSTNCTDIQWLLDFYARNDIVWFNPCTKATVCSEFSSTDLIGIAVEEKIWNYYAQKGLKPHAIAGIMGNFSQESMFDPAIKQNHTTKAIPPSGDGKTGYGLAQWTYNTRQAGLFKRMDAAGLSKYYGAGWGASEVNKQIPIADLDKLTQVELDYTWDNDVEGNTVKKLLNQLNSAPNAAAASLIFHEKYEQSADTYQGLQERADDATDILAKYGGNVINAIAPSGDACQANSTVGGVSSVEDAMAWVEKFIKETEDKYLGTPQLRSNMTINYDATVSRSYGTFHYTHRFSHAGASYCWQAADCGQCTAVSGWFALTQTNLSRYPGGNGGKVVGNLANMGVPKSQTPKPFSIFSGDSGSPWGHTGLVLGVLDNGDVITAEANPDGKGSIGVWQGNFTERYGAGKTTFADLTEYLINDAAAAVNNTGTQQITPGGGGPLLNTAV